MRFWDSGSGGSTPSPSNPIIKVVGLDAAGNQYPLTLGPGLAITGNVLDVVGGGGGSTRPQGKNLLTWTPGAPAGTQFYSAPPLQDLTGLTDGFGGSIAVTTPGTKGMLVEGAGTSFELTVTFAAATYLNEIKYYSGQFNGATFNAPTTLTIFDNTTQLKQISLQAIAADQTFDLLTDAAFDSQFTALRLVFGGLTGLCGVRELGLYGV